jgi:trimethylamine--corrinoid protein Co-methyltransferase
MKSMMATYGGPETRKMEAGASQLAARYNLLTRGNVCLSDAQDLDYQAGAESTFNLISALASGINYLPGCGIAGGFATASREKLVLDADLVAAARHFLAPIRIDSLSEVEELIKKVGPKGSYITSPHTLRSFRKELHHPSVFSRISNQKWVERNENICQLAAKRADQLLKSYTMPKLDPVLTRRLKDELPFLTNS